MFRMLHSLCVWCNAVNFGAQCIAIDWCNALVISWRTRFHYGAAALVQCAAELPQAGPLASTQRELEEGWGPEGNRWELMESSRINHSNMMRGS